MQCKQLDSLLDAYMDGEVVGELKNALRRHAESCVDCRARIGQERALRARLAALPTEGPGDGFFAQALSAAKEAPPDELSAGAKPHRHWAIGSGGALAAGFALWFAAGYLLHSPAVTSSPALPEIAISMSHPTPVNLVFTSTGDLTGARVSLQLPAGIELAGYDGRRELTWTTDLKDGKNVLRLPLIAHAVPAEEIVARLEHGDETKTFRLKVRVKPTTQGTVL